MGDRKESLVDDVKCVLCGDQTAWSRGLCSSCYSDQRRNGFLDDWPTQKYLDNPYAHIRWAFGYNLQDVADIAIEFGYRLEKV